MGARGAGGGTNGARRYSRCGRQRGRLAGCARGYAGHAHDAAATPCGIGRAQRPGRGYARHVHDAAAAPCNRGLAWSRRAVGPCWGRPVGKHACPSAAAQAPPSRRRAARASRRKGRHIPTDAARPMPHTAYWAPTGQREHVPSIGRLAPILSLHAPTRTIDDTNAHQQVVLTPPPPVVTRAIPRPKRCGEAPSR